MRHKCEVICIKLSEGITTIFEDNFNITKQYIQFKTYPDEKNNTIKIINGSYFRIIPGKRKYI